MEPTVKTFLKGAVKVRLRRCAVASVYFVFLGFLLTASLVLDKGSFPDVVSIVTRGKAANAVVADRAAWNRLETGGSLGEQGHQLGQTNRSCFKEEVSAPDPAVVAYALQVAARKEVSGALDVESEPEAAEERGSEDESGELEGDEQEEEDEKPSQQAIRNETWRVERVDYTDWDSRVGCESFRRKKSPVIRFAASQPLL